MLSARKLQSMCSVSKGGSIVQVRKILASALVGGMVLVVPVSTAFASTSAPKGGEGGGLLGGLLGGDEGGGLLGSNGCKEDELLCVGGDQGIVGVNDDLKLETDHGLLGLALGCEHKN